MHNKYKHILYKFTRKYGQIGTFVTQSQTGDVDLETGVQTIASVNYSVKMIVMPSRVWRTFVESLAFIASNKNFTYGGLFDTTQRQVIIDRRLMPTISPEDIMNSKVVIATRNYIVMEFHEYENEGFNQLLIKEIVGV
jgi:hypothetical protein